MQYLAKKKEVDIIRFIFRIAKISAHEI